MAFEKMKKIRDSNDYQLEAMLGLTEDFRSGLLTKCGHTADISFTFIPATV